MPDKNNQAQKIQIDILGPRLTPPLSLSLSGRRGAVDGCQAGVSGGEDVWRPAAGVPDAAAEGVRPAYRTDAVPVLPRPGRAAGTQ